VELLPAVPTDPDTPTPTVTVNQTDTTAPRPIPLDTHRCVRTLADGRQLALDRQRGTATFFGPPLTTDLLAHPYLGPIATTFNRWAGRETFHAGAFVMAGRAWAVLGPRTAGKSTLLAALANHGVPIISDDILVTDAGHAYAGPRCIDLRQPIPDNTLRTRPVREQTRLRITLPPTPTRVPLGGWLFLHWGNTFTMTNISAPRLLTRLAGHRSWKHLPTDPAAMLAIAALPAWDLTRPRDLSALDLTCQLLATTLDR
jgi:hypothetical protein